MIDIESQVFDLLCRRLETKWPNINVSNDTVNAPSAFPCVAMEEIDNYPNKRTQDSVHYENTVIVTYEVAVYSTKPTGRKRQAKALAAEVSDFFQSIGFVRKSMNPAPVIGDKYFRLVLRFTAEVGADEKIYRR